jgi:TonB family protein
MYQATRSIHARATLLAVLALGIAGCATATAADDAAKQRAVVRFDSCAKPNYPAADLKAGHEGTVTLAFLVETSGKVAESKVATSSGFPGLDEAARSAIAKCTFDPARQDGKPVRDWTKVQYVWTKG